VTGGVLALARSIQLLAPAPQQLLLAGVTNGHSNGHVAIPEDETIEYLVRPLVESAETEAASLLDASIEALAIAMEPPTASEPRALASDTRDAVETTSLESTEAAPVATEQLAALAAALERVPAVETVAPAVEQVAPAVEAPVEAVAAIPDEPTYDPGPLSNALELHAEALLHVINTQLDAFESAIRSIVATFQARPVCALLAAPREIVIAPARPATQWLRTTRPSIRSVKPSGPNSSSLSSGPLTSALAGPCLPADLRTLGEKMVIKPGRPKRANVPTWVISLLVATGLLLGAGRFVQYVSENQEAKAAPASSQHPAQASAGTLISAPGDPHPLARFVEVTGLRISADLNRKSQLQYLVVNHSSVRLADATLKIAVRSAADSSGAPPLFTLSVVVPGLGPYQSKELRTDLDAALRSASIPDWENLRADVQVSTKQ